MTCKNLTYHFKSKNDNIFIFLLYILDVYYKYVTDILYMFIMDNGLTFEKAPYLWLYSAGKAKDCICITIVQNLHINWMLCTLPLKAKACEIRAAYMACGAFIIYSKANHLPWE